jgi:hypothetical protein
MQSIPLRRKVMRFVRIAFCAAVLAAIGLATGQTSPGDVVVDVPFAFIVAGQQLPAGRYIVTSRDGFIRIFSTNKEGLFVPTHAAVRTASDESKLVFHHYGDTYFLSCVWVKGTTTGKQLYPSRAEREVAARQAEMELAVVRPAQ